MPFSFNLLLSSIWYITRIINQLMPLSKVIIYHYWFQFNWRLWKQQRWINIVVPKVYFLLEGEWVKQKYIFNYNIREFYYKGHEEQVWFCHHKTKTYKQCFYWKLMNSKLDLWKVNKTERLFFPPEKKEILNIRNEKDHYYRS